MTTDERARALEHDIQSPGSADGSEMRPYLEIARAIRRESDAPPASMDATSAAKQRETLIARARAISAKETAPADPDRSASKQAARIGTTAEGSDAREPWSVRMKRPFRALVRGAVPVAVIALILIFLFSSFVPYMQNGQKSSPAAAIAELIIPAAHAADAFTVTVEKEDAAGAATGTTFLIESKIDLSPDTLNDHLEIVPAAATGTTAVRTPIAVNVDAVKDKGDTFRATPEHPLDPGTVYDVRIMNTAIKSDDGSKQARTFSWAIQTKDVFRILSTVPGANASQVPINTGIEATVNMGGWSDPAKHFSITPDVKGRFEVHGRSIAFVPEKPLAFGTVYTVTYAKDWGVENSDLTLGSDVVLHFETISETQDKINNRKVVSVRPAERFVTAAPGQELPVSVYETYTSAAPDAGPVTVTGYGLSESDARTYLEQELAIPSYAYEKRYGGSLEQTFAKTTAFTLNATIAERNYTEVIDLPNTLPIGRYLVSLTSRDSITSWFFLQVTNVATYVASDKDTTLIWAVHAGESRPLARIPVTAGDEKTTTDDSGLARIKTPIAIASSTAEGGTVATIGEGNQVALVRLGGSSQYRPYDYYSYGNDGKTISSMHADRPLYRPTDRAEISGIVQDRASKHAPNEPVTIELANDEFNYWSGLGWAPAKSYASVTVTPDADGFFRASIDWSNIFPRTYSLQLKRGDVLVDTQMIEVRDYVKPAYTLDVSLDQSDVTAGNPFTGIVRAAFFDGTPMPNLKVAVQVSGRNNELIHLTTDEDGKAAFSVKTAARPCAPDDNAYGACPTSESYAIHAAPEGGEEAAIDAYAYGTLWDVASVLSADVTNVSGGRANVTVRAAKLDLVKLKSGEGNDGSYDPYGMLDPIPSIDVNAYVTEHSWDRIESGTTYDPVTKTTSPNYTYTEKSDVVQRLTQKTDAKGNTTFAFPIQKDRWYELTSYVKDGLGAWSRIRTSVSPCDWCQMNPSYQRAPSVSFQPTTAHPLSWIGYRVGDMVSYGLYLGDELLPRSSSSTYLYYEAMMGIRNARVSNDPSVAYPFTDGDIPNETLLAIAFRNGHFEPYQTAIAFDDRVRALTVQTTADQAEYAPGARANVTVRALDADGKPKANAHVTLALVDEALFAAANYDPPDDPLPDIYATVTDGLLFTYVSHEAMLAAGAEGGGGGGDATTPRKNFKDTAAYLTGVTDANGDAVFSTLLPDNITSWRATAIAISGDLFAGSSRLKIPVTKPAFVNVTAPDTVLTGDVPQIKIRAFGRALKTGDAVTYTVNASTLGIANRSVTSTVGASAYVSIDHPAVGDNTVTVSMKTANGTDAIERHITVVGSRFERDTVVRTAASTSMKIDPGLAKEISVRFVPKTRAQYLDELYALRWGWTDRIESQIAKRMSEKLLREQFGKQDLPASADPSMFLKYQQDDGGIAILPYASSDVELSAKVAAAAPDLIDPIRLAAYFRTILANDKSSREEQVNAVSGLAALGEPALIDLRSFAKLGDLTWRERIALGRGFAAIGDDTGARAQLDALLANAKTQDQRMWVPVSSVDTEVYEATAAAAAIAVRLGDARGYDLNEWVKHSWIEHAFAPLETASYLAVAVPAAEGQDATLAYDVGKGTQTVELKNGWPEEVRLTASEAHAFKVLGMNAPVDIAYDTIVSDRPQNAKELTLSRRILVNGATSTNAIHENDAVTVELTAAFSKDAPDGDYTIRDTIASGFIPTNDEMSLVTNDAYRYYVSPFEGANPSFTVWKPTDGKPVVIRYGVRPVTKGSYVVEPAAIQKGDMPNMTAISADQHLTIE